MQVFIYKQFKSIAIRIQSAVIVGVFCFFSVPTNAQQQEKDSLQIRTEFKSGAFPLVRQGIVPSILIDTADAAVVGITANALATDLEGVSGSKPAVISSLSGHNDYLVIAGTIGHSTFIDQLIKEKKIDVSKVRDKWESFTVTIVNTPLKGVNQGLVVAGSDRRGTAYGLFEISRRAGVSPWVWWADVKPAPQKSLYVWPGSLTSGEPSVKYRGIFINDEDWGLNPWAKRNMDTDIGDIGPKTYARVFELLLRLRANLIWPAMHDSTKAFWYYPDNPKIADQYAIVLGSTHCDMMLRSNTFEWQKNFEQEYGVKPGTYRYDSNKAQIYKYWDDRVAASRNYESMYTVGMRGVRDGAIVGPATQEGKIALTETVIRDQRSIFRKYFGANTNALQIFCPYKEVLSLYQDGLVVPEDVTLVWTDDNFGYIRQLSTPAEQRRSGASGIYYHLSYLGGPHDYLWLSTNSPSLVSFEMNKAFQFGANRFWVVNVGDIKPAEMEIQFFLDMAWDTKKWTPQNAQQYTGYWAQQTFGKDVAPQIAGIKNEYYRLAQSGKPEHLGILHFDNETKRQRLADYAGLVAKVEEVKKRIPGYLQNAFFELIEYPVKGAALMNQKIFYAEMSFDETQQAAAFSRKAKDAFEEIKSLTRRYNTGIENEKWNGIITYAPRNLSVYGMPAVAAPEILDDSLKTMKIYDRRYLDTARVEAGIRPGQISIPAGSYKSSQAIAAEAIATMPGLGLGGKSITRYPFTGVSFQKEDFKKAPFVEYAVLLKGGKYRLSLKCLPNKAIHKGRSLAIAVAVNHQPPQFADVDNPREDKVWKANLLRGYSEAIIPLDIAKAGESTIRIYLMDTGLALSRIDIEAE